MGWVCNRAHSPERGRSASEARRVGGDFQTIILLGPPPQPSPFQGEGAHRLRGGCLCYGNIKQSPQIEISWPEMVGARLEQTNTTASAICCGVTMVRIDTTVSASSTICL